MSSASRFSGIRDASPSNRNRRLEPGQYLLKVEALRYFVSTKTHKPVFVADFEVVDSSHADFAPGDIVSYPVVQGKFANYFFADIKQVIAAVSNLKDEEVDEETADSAVSEEQPLKGETVRCFVTPNAKAPEFPTHRFLPAA